ncbi:protein C2-DOMAIN ABA-RELATED 4-like isoform X2 [Olea europaea var. sylvestris]|uniref:protein C2-DOMAIN ABA-RELATED 4-like isoform X2 n=1 Tax=Olea europaea var. sylvestris TaxID=158386 RepID=UPI000C1D718F|nr:protein C2-DOMAIN ABA-RELATED 4-like isoform X2 [Olea europaea var. sylvestris]
MENLLGLQRINVIRGIKLAIRDASARSSDPYVVVTMANQEVFDRDTFTPDDKIGDAEFDIKTFVEVAMMRLQSMTSGTIIRKIKPNRENCLAEESPITWENQKVIQRMYLRLRNVECGEIELQLQWIETPDSRGL